MSRTLRRLAPRGRYSLKRYSHGFTILETEMTPQRISALWVAIKHRRVRTSIPLAEAEADPTWGDPYSVWLMHHEMFRNGSCRRQRINGVRETKRIFARQERAQQKAKLRKILYTCDEIG